MKNKNPKYNYITLDDKNAMRCDHCGIEKTIPEGLSNEGYAEAYKMFIRNHKFCKPKEQMLLFI